MKLEGDIFKVANMPVNKLAYSRPSRISVCADENYVHGMKFHLQLQEMEEGSFGKQMFDKMT